MITLEETKIFLGISGTDQDAKLQQMIDSAESLFITLVGDITEQTRTEKYSGDDSKTLILKGFNVSFPNYEIDSWIKVGRTTTQLIDIIAIEIEDSTLINVDGIFQCGIKNIEVKYLSGYTETPSDVKQALFSLVGMFNGDAGKESVSSESIGDYSVNYGGKGYSYPPIFKIVVDNYRKYF